MRRLVVFNNITLDGFFTDANGQIAWAHKGNDKEYNDFVAENAKGGDTLILGRKTYQELASFWPTEQAKKTMPEAAEGMNRMRKLVFSKSLNDATWSNTTLLKGDIAEEVRRVKQEAGGDIAILGSGSIVSALAQQGLIDEYQVVVNPVVIGKGRTMFDRIRSNMDLQLTKSRVFGNGKVYLCYEPTKGA